MKLILFGWFLSKKVNKRSTCTLNLSRIPYRRNNTGKEGHCVMEHNYICVIFYCAPRFFNKNIQRKVKKINKKRQWN